MRGLRRGGSHQGGGSSGRDARTAIAARAVPNDSPVSHQRIGDMVTQLMASSGNDCGRESTLFLADNKNRHSWRCSTAHTFSYVLSALLMPTRFDTVSLMSALDALDATSRRHVWLWIAHTIFSSSSRGTIKFFELEALKITAEDIAALWSYLQSSNPVALLCHPANRLPEARDHTGQPRKRVSLPVSTKILLFPRHGHLFLPAAGWYDVIQEDHQYVDVIIPAYGQCRALKTSAVEWEELPKLEPRESFGDHSVTSMKIWINFSHDITASDAATSANTDHAFVARAQALLKTVGNPVQSLDICSHNTQESSLLGAIFSSCPRLLSLHTSHLVIPGLHDLVAAYESGKCRLTALEIRSCRNRDGYNFRAVEAALVDPRTRIASTLREIWFGTVYDEWSYLWYGALAPPERTLENSNTIRYLRLDGEPNFRVTLDTEITSHNGEVLPGAGDPLPITCKCAFLSVVNGADNFEDAISGPAMASLSQLDSNLLSVIFAFARRPVERVMFFS